MASIPLSSRAFTLIETLVVIGIVVLIAGFSVTAGFKSFGKAMATSDVQTIETVLRQARNNTQAGVCQQEPCEGLGQLVAIAPSFITLSEQSANILYIHNSYPLSGAYTDEPTSFLFIGGSGQANASSSLSASTFSEFWKLNVDLSGRIDSVVIPH